MTRQVRTASEHQRELREVGVVEGDIVLCHYSLKHLALDVPGPAPVIEALASAVGESGTVVFPAHSSHLTHPRTWVNPPVPREEWDQIADGIGPWDGRTTPTNDIGVVAEYFRTRPGVFRSDHPVYSMCASGNQAERIVGHHDLDDGLGDGSPLAVSAALGAKVLMVGTTYRSCTALHLSESRAAFPGKRYRPAWSPMLVDGEKRWVEYCALDEAVDDFEDVGVRLEAEGVVHRLDVAGCVMRLASMAELVARSTELISVLRARPRRHTEGR
jgi:aminoglycoside 3-N-acetyltransferase